jgi:hypothetical protein
MTNSACTLPLASRRLSALTGYEVVERSRKHRVRDADSPVPQGDGKPLGYRSAKSVDDREATLCRSAYPCGLQRTLGFSQQNRLVNLTTGVLVAIEHRQDPCSH